MQTTWSEAERRCSANRCLPPLRSRLSIFLFLFDHGLCRRNLGLYWRECRDGDDGARELFDRHYSRRFYADGRQPKLFVGPGEKLVLITEDGKALWVWRKFIDASGQQVVNCAVFRNEGETLSCALILDAENAAWLRWPGQRLYTYVHPKKIRSCNPGACFRFAGWRWVGVTLRNKMVILEKWPNDPAHRRRANSVRLSTETRARRSVQPVCWKRLLD